MPEGFDLSSYDSEGADLLLQMPECLVDTSVLSSDAEGEPVLPPGFWGSVRTSLLMAVLSSWGKVCVQIVPKIKDLLFKKTG